MEVSSHDLKPFAGPQRPERRSPMCAAQRSVQPCLCRRAMGLLFGNEIGSTCVSLGSIHADGEPRKQPFNLTLQWTSAQWNCREQPFPATTGRSPRAPSRGLGESLNHRFAATSLGLSLA